MAFEYTVVAHPTSYNGVLFRSRLEARWAAFFDLINWTWEYEPLDLEGWTPDFKVTFNCGHSECPSRHKLLAEVKPFYSLEQFKGMPVERNAYGQKYGSDGGLMLGQNPHITGWEMSHGAGGGFCTVEEWVDSRSFHTIDQLWAEAGNRTQWSPR